MAVRELIRVLADAGSFVEIGGNQPCGIVTGLAMIQIRTVSVLAVEKAMLRENALQRAEKLLDKTLLTGSPLLMLFEDAECVENSDALWPFVKKLVRLSGVCPLLALQCSEIGEMAKKVLPYADFRLYCASATAPAGCLDLHAQDVPAAVETLRTLITLLPLNCAEEAPLLDIGDEMNRPSEMSSAVSAQEAIRALSDEGSILQLYQDQHALCALVRIGGRVTGVIAAADDNAVRDAARFVRFCDCYSLPLLWVAEAKLPDDERLIFALAEATVSKVLLTLQTENCARELFDITLGITGTEGESCADDASAAQDLRVLLINSLEMLCVKRDVLPPHKHGNIPLSGG